MLRDTHPSEHAGIEATIREALGRQKLSPMDQVRKAIGAALKFEETGSMDAPDLNSQMEAYGAAAAGRCRSARST